MQLDFPFLQLVFVGFLALFPAVNPVGSAFIVDPLLSGLDLTQRRAATKRIAFYCLVICTVSIIAGSYILKLFGISIPIVQLCGGIMICRMGWQLLTSEDGIQKGNKETARPSGEIENLLFYPISFPMTTGAGTISVLLTLSAHGEDTDMSKHLIKLGALFIAIVLICILIYICYVNTPRLIKRLGPRGEQIVNKLSAFLVFCIGMQIASAGIRSLLKM
ncbi:MAG TPA: MarC family protein [Puia sp.]|nr:MarC family protein [Puia sp.]